MDYLRTLHWGGRFWCISWYLDSQPFCFEKGKFCFPKRRDWQGASDLSAALCSPFFGGIQLLPRLHQHPGVLSNNRKVTFWRFIPMGLLPLWTITSYWNFICKLWHQVGLFSIRIWWGYSAYCIRTLFMDSTHWFPRIGNNCIHMLHNCFPYCLY